MSQVKISGDASGTGILTIAAPNTNSNFTLTLPATTAPILAGSGITLSASAPANTLVTDASGNVGIGTSSPATKLHVATAANTGILVSSTDGTTFKGIAFNTSDNQFTVGTQTNHLLALFTNNTERARIDTSGNLLVGTTSGIGNPKFCVNYSQGVTNGIVINVNGTAASQAVVFMNGNGDVGAILTSGSSTSYGTSSDYRLKNTITPMTGALAKVALLKPCTYKWKVDGLDGEGFIAHELAEVCPSAVTGEKDAVENYTDEDGVEQTRIKPQGIDTSFLVATLTAAIQEQQALITALTARITALEQM